MPIENREEKQERKVLGGPQQDFFGKGKIAEDCKRPKSFRISQAARE